MIPIQHEDIEELKAWGWGLEHVQERCHLCSAKTRYWHMATNTPVCQTCAEKYTEDYLYELLKEEEPI